MSGTLKDKKWLLELGSWLKQFRLVTVSYAVLMSVVAFKISGLSIPLHWYILIGGLMFFGGAATMAENNLYDKEHDLKKCKTFAFDHAEELRLVVNLLWAVSCILAIAILFSTDPRLGLLSAFLLVLGFGYSTALQIKYAPGIYVAFVSTGPVLYAFLLEPSLQIALLILATVPFILGRENLKDIDDIEIDRGYKHTIAGALGARNAKIFTGVLYMAAISIVLVAVELLKLQERLVSTVAIITASVLIIASVYLLFADKNHKVSKKLGDFAMLIVMVTLFVSFTW